ncbi:DUF3644 domain-containing protein [Methylacidimicrobium tartarophylax]|uniref:DUF3644 domain-containing protein n=1 Tax=Methylacidimicrobium tartarophylax TaxID=1041768 RepID=UPI001FEAC598|nr:DUF3644 domain-containing protein [Methylacidimicrobium tartarophylax]
MYNKPDFRYRAESFTILALNAWELLLKSKWLVGNGNRLSSLYVREGGGRKRPRYKRTRSRSPFTHSVDYLAKKLTEMKVMNEACSKNLEALAELRNTVVHFYHKSPQLAERVQEIGMATVKNFASAAQDWFEEDLSWFNFYLMPLSFVTPPSATEVVELNKEEKNFLRYVKSLDDQYADPNARYSVSINVEVHFVRSKSVAATPVRVTNDPTATEVRLTEEQISERYPWDYRKLSDECRKLYSGFKVDRRYHELRRELERDTRFAHVRRLDPRKAKSSKKTFYSPAILQEFDKTYKTI